MIEWLWVVLAVLFCLFGLILLVIVWAHDKELRRRGMDRGEYRR